MVNRIFAPAQEHIARELYRGSYRSRSPKGLCPGGSWRYIAGGLCRGGEAEEEKEEEGRKEDGRKLRNLTTPHRVVGNNTWMNSVTLCFLEVWTGQKTPASSAQLF